MILKYSEFRFEMHRIGIIWMICRKQNAQIYCYLMLFVAVVVLTENWCSFDAKINFIRWKNTHFFETFWGFFFFFFLCERVVKCMCFFERKCISLSEIFCWRLRFSINNDILRILNSKSKVFTWILLSSSSLSFCCSFFCCSFQLFSCPLSFELSSSIRNKNSSKIENKPKHHAVFFDKKSIFVEEILFENAWNIENIYMLFETLQWA